MEAGGIKENVLLASGSLIIINHKQLQSCRAATSRVNADVIEHVILKVEGGKLMQERI